MLWIVWVINFDLHIISAVIVFTCWSFKNLVFSGLMQHLPHIVDK